MARRGPSLIALLGLLAVAGYRNRDTVSDMVGRFRSAGAPAKTSSGKPATGFGDQLDGLLGGSPIGAALTTAVNELIGMFKGTPQEERAGSWVSNQPNTPVQSTELADVIGRETLDDLVDRTGLSEAQLLEALADKLPIAIDGLTPEGRVPTDEEARSFL